VGLPGEVTEFSVGGNGWIVDGQPAPVIRGERVMNPDELADPVIEDDQIYGPNQPTTIVGINSTFTLPAGLRLTARGEYQAGHYVTAGGATNAIGRSVVWAGCFDEYEIAGEAPISSSSPGYGQLTALQRARCDADLTDSNFWAEKADFFKLRELSLQAPLPDNLIPGTSGSTLTLAGRNIWRWTNSEWTHFDPEMGGNNDNNPISRDGSQPGSFLVTSISEHIPAPAIWTLALRVVF
jgi:hypothetical protein